MGIGSFSDESLEQLEGLGRSAKKATTSTPNDLKNTAQSQLSPTGPNNNANGYAPDEVQELNEQAYGVKKQTQHQGNSSSQGIGSQKQNILSMITGSKQAEKSPEELKKMQELRNKLHYEVYYQQLDTIGKTKQQEKEQEEQMKEKEEEKKKEMVLQKEEKKKEELSAVTNARKGTGEVRGGVGG